MRSVDAIKLLHKFDLEGKYLYTNHELSILFDERDQTFLSTMKRLRADGILRHVAHKTYMYALTSQISRSWARDLAVFLRPGHYTYESLESASSMWGFISQVPIGHLMCVTTGRSGFVSCFDDFQIEYVHRDFSYNEIKNRMVDREPQTALPLATKQAALDDMLACPGRSVDLISWEDVDDDDEF